MSSPIGRLLRSDAAFMFAGRAVQYAAQIAMVLILPKVLLPGSYTELNLVLPIAFLGVPFLFGWISSALYRYAYEFLDSGQSGSRRTSTVYVVIVSGAMVLVFVVVSQVTSSVYRVIPLLLVAAGLKKIVLNVLNAGRLDRRFLLATVGYAASLALFIGLCGLYGNTQLAGILVVYGAADIVVGALFWPRIRTRAARVKASPIFDTEILVRYLRYGVPLMANGLGGWVIALSDRYFLALWWHPKEVAGYILSYQLAASAITIPMTFLLTIVFPRILSLDKDKGPEAALAYTYRLLGYYLRLMVPAALVASVVIMAFKHYVYTAYPFDPAVIVIIVIAHTIQGMDHFYSKEFELNGRTMVVARSVAVGAGVNVVANVLLIPWIGALGAAVATAIAYAATVSVLFRARRYRPAGVI